MASQAIRAGDGDVFLVAGVEATSSPPPVVASPHPAFAGAESGANELFESGAQRKDPRERDGLPDVNISMGKTAEFVARITGTTRQDQDHGPWSPSGERREGFTPDAFAGEISPVTTTDGRVVDADDCPRPSTTMDSLSGLEPAFLASGTVTAGMGEAVSLSRARKGAAGWWMQKRTVDGESTASLACGA